MTSQQQRDIALHQAYMLIKKVEDAFSLIEQNLGGSWEHSGALLGFIYELLPRPDALQKAKEWLSSTLKDWSPHMVRGLAWIEGLKIKKGYQGHKELSLDYVSATDGCKRRELAFKYLLTLIDFFSSAFFLAGPRLHKLVYREAVCSEEEIACIFYSLSELLALYIHDWDQIMWVEEKERSLLLKAHLEMQEKEREEKNGMKSYEVTLEGSAGEGALRQLRQFGYIIAKNPEEALVSFLSGLEKKHFSYKNISSLKIEIKEK